MASTVQTLQACDLQVPTSNLTYCITMKLHILICSSLFFHSRAFIVGHVRTIAARPAAVAVQFPTKLPSRDTSTSLLLAIDPDTNTSTADITLKQKAEVILYRLTLISASAAYATLQLSNLLLASGSGLSTQTISSIEHTSHGIVGWGILFSALLAPPYLGAITDKNEKNDVDNALFLLLNELLPTLASFAIVVEIVNTIQSNLSQGAAEFLSATSATLDSTTNIFICAICLREIGFFGASYKAEAILAILCCVVLGLNDFIGFSEPVLTSGLALCLMVLSFGKVFEPLKDDFKPNNSAFFKDNP